MAVSCGERAERVERTVVRSLGRWVRRREQSCRDERRRWRVLCLNRLFCWLVVILAKLTRWLATVVLRWVYRTVCTVVTVVVGLAALVVGNTEILPRAVRDLWTLAKDGFYSVVGTVVFVILRIVDLVQTVLGRQQAKRRLTDDERELLRPVFGESLNYDAIKLVPERAGILTTSGRPFTMGFTIYLPSHRDKTLVHECVHVWQFQFGGFRYIGNSAFHQLGSLASRRRYHPYRWRPRMDAGESWYALRSVEAQAQFIEDLYENGIFGLADRELPDGNGPGAFFREDESGKNAFVVAGVTYTSQANAAWQVLRAG